MFVVIKGDAEISNLFVLGNYFYLEEYHDKSDIMLNGITGYFEKNVSSFVNWFHLYMMKSSDFYEVAIVGDDFMLLKAEMEKQFLPNVILMGGENEGGLELLKNKLIEGETRIYVCKEKMCKLPVDEVVKALDQLMP